MVGVDIAVIGGGVTGLAAALALAEQGFSVCVLEREGKPGRATSTHNSGVIHAGLYPTGSLKAQLCVERRIVSIRSARRTAWPKRCGKLIVAADAHEAEALHALLKKAHENGVTSVVEVDGAFVAAKELIHAVAALWFDTGIVETGTGGRWCISPGSRRRTGRQQSVDGRGRRGDDGTGPPRTNQARPW